MDTANAVSGVQSLGSNLLRRPSVAPGGGPEGEAPPSGIVPMSGQQQTVGPLTKTEKSDTSGHGNKPDRQQVSDAVKNMNDFLQMVQRTLQFSLDEDSGEMVVKIKDAQTNEVIRQIPSEAMLKLAKELDKLKGLLFEEKA